jgi:CheY-like chemotaxis protein
MKFNVLIADDEKNIREGLGRSLERDDYNVFLAGDGREALATVEEN